MSSTLRSFFVDAAHERRDQRHAGVCASYRLREAEQQGKVAVDAFALECLRGADALPGAGQLDQHALARDPGLGVERDQVARPGKAAIDVERQIRIDLGRDAAFGVLEDLAAEIHRELGHCCPGFALPVALRARAEGERVFNQRAVLRVLRRLVKQRRIGGRILRPQPRDGIDVAGVRNDDGVLFQGFEQIHGALL